MSKEKWIADVQYGDMTGRAEADDHANGIDVLRTRLKSNGVDASRYEPVGIVINMEEELFCFEVICKDATGRSKKITSFRFEKKQDPNELREIFKRLDVYLLGKRVCPEYYDWLGCGGSTRLTIIHHPGGGLIGTAAADGHECAISGLKDYLKDKGIDTSTYEPIGIVIQIGASQFDILCADQTSKKIIPFGFKETQDLGELHKILKRLHVILLDNQINPWEYDWSDFDKSEMIDNIPEYLSE